MITEYKLYPVPKYKISGVRKKKKKNKEEKKKKRKSLKRKSQIKGPILTMVATRATKVVKTLCFLFFYLCRVKESIKYTAGYFLSSFNGVHSRLTSAYVADGWRIVLLQRTVHCTSLSEVLVKYARQHACPSKITMYWLLVNVVSRGVCSQCCMHISFTGKSPPYSSQIPVASMACS
jgi:hypothetical protein